MANLPDAAATIETSSYLRGGEASRSYLLVCEFGSSSIFLLPPEGEIVIGRSSEADLQIRDSAASRRHARLSITRTSVTIADLDSHNGTRRNGHPLSAPTALESGDVISICDT